MTQKVTLDESIKVNLDSDTHDKIADKAEEIGLSKSAMARTILKQEVQS